MTLVLPPLPTSLPPAAASAATRGIPVQSFPVPGGTTAPRGHEPLALPALGDFASRPFETPAPDPAPAPVRAAEPAATPAPKAAAEKPPEPDFTDADLTAALLPLDGSSAGSSCPAAASFCSRRAHWR